MITFQIKLERNYFENHFLSKYFWNKVRQNFISKNEPNFQFFIFQNITFFSVGSQLRFQKMNQPLFKSQFKYLIHNNNTRWIHSVWEDLDRKKIYNIYISFVIHWLSYFAQLLLVFVWIIAKKDEEQKAFYPFSIFWHKFDFCLDRLSY